jgi:hypothetical protein
MTTGQRPEISGDPLQLLRLMVMRNLRLATIADGYRLMAGNTWSRGTPVETWELKWLVERGLIDIVWPLDEPRIFYAPTAEGRRLARLFS